MTRKKFDRLLMAALRVGRNDLPAMRMIALGGYGSYAEAIDAVAHKLRRCVEMSGGAMPRVLIGRELRV